MYRHMRQVFVRGFLVAITSCSCATKPPSQPTSEQQIAAVIEANRGWVTFSGATEDAFVFAAGLRSSTTDPAAVLRVLPRLRNLEMLFVEQVPVTDADVEYLKPLTKLKHLNLTCTKVTDAGLECLAGLTSLEELEICVTL